MATAKYSKTCNSQFVDRPVRQTDFERDVTEFHSIAKYTNTIIESTNMEDQPTNNKKYALQTRTLLRQDQVI